jgi:amylosucrase
LESAIEAKDAALIQTSINKILLMQAQSMFVGGLPMLFYGDELGYTNDYSYLKDPGKSYDNRWMHRPIIDWKRTELVDKKGTIEQQVFESMQRLIGLRKSLVVVADLKNTRWLEVHNNSVSGFERSLAGEKVFFLFNFSASPQALTWYVLNSFDSRPVQVTDMWSQETLQVGMDHEYMHFAPYQFRVLK